MDRAGGEGILARHNSTIITHCNLYSSHIFMDGEIYLLLEEARLPLPGAGHQVRDVCQLDDAGVVLSLDGMEQRQEAGVRRFTFPVTDLSFRV